MTSRFLAATAAVSAALAMATWTAEPVFADPCGMVPPMQMSEQNAIKRVGLQKTFVSYHKGVETMVLRPGFSGKIDEFGMLIPFPSPPAIRKVDDTIFSHIAAAVDPPEILAYVQRNWNKRRGMRSGAGAPTTAEKSTAAADEDLSFDTVKVVKREAVGMYDVAVLAAGSARALERWMDDHQFRYPTGMDETVQDYVSARWYFVAVKTKVGNKAGVNPRPGMRRASAKLPSGATFNGHVQAMGFRFRSDELVVPMRLSVFNPGEARNVVYVLTDGPKRLDNIPRRFVMRQISGQELYDNITRPLPLRVIGGSYKDLAPWQKQNLKAQRNPAPHNGGAKKLFAADLLAIYSSRLANPVEEREKALLSIGERLGLRGAAIDGLHAQELKKAGGAKAERALHHLKRMTLTVIDGEFDRDVLARQNLTFARYHMPKHRNNRRNYDARTFAPGGVMGGKLYRKASLELVEDTGSATAATLIEPTEPNARSSRLGRFAPTGAALFAAVLLFGVARRRRASASWLALALAVSVAGLALGTSTLAWGDGGPRKGIPAYKVDSKVKPPRDHRSIEALIAQLGDSEKAEQAASALAKIGPRAIDPLLDELWDSQDAVQKGWAIIALTEVGSTMKKSDTVDRELAKLHADGRQDILVRTWAAAARIELAKTSEALFALSGLAGQLPALQRPLALRAVALVGELDGPEALEAMLMAVNRMPRLSGELQAKIMAAGSRAMAHVMVRSKDQNTRRMAASYLGAMANQGDKNVARRVIAKLRFRRKAEKAAWDGGALFIPALRWSKEDARALVDHLIRWHLWAELKGEHQAKRQIYNNLVSIRLTGAAGYRPGGSDTLSWLRSWRQAAGRSAVKAILTQQGVAKDSRYRSVLSGQ